MCENQLLLLSNMFFKMNKMLILRLFGVSYCEVSFLKLAPIIPIVSNGFDFRYAFVTGCFMHAFVLQLVCDVVKSLKQE